MGYSTCCNPRTTWHMSSTIMAVRTCIGTTSTLADENCTSIFRFHFIRSYSRSSTTKTYLYHGSNNGKNFTAFVNSENYVYVGVLIRKYG